MSPYVMPGLKEKVINLKRIVSLDAISKAITIYYDMDMATIRTKGRNKRVVYARYIMCYLLRKHTALTLKEIGRQLYPAITGHTTVMHGVSFIKGQLSLKSDTEIKTIMNEIYI